ncbi:unnamed protein product [Brachionus calyciflorus]|uniref:Endonuclease/exonuclease/phosphatase domain-containing protein n=1 Tax=Brachionus calyciflorus TaxID=104777 RepID=A0A813UJN1_9BILA|nr:unnamed protein product [Brachionus calyciflorus]
MLIKNIVLELESKDIKGIIMGDFNTNLNRHGHHCNKFKEFLNFRNMTSKDLDLLGKNQFTNEKKVNNKLFRSWIDHILIKKDEKYLKNLNVDSCPSNLGDHRVQSCELE